MSFDQLTKGARSLGIELDSRQIDAFETYYQELVQWNARFNLTTITEQDDVIVKHFLDSLSLAPWVRAETLLIDVGSGAGFPGIPLKIVFQDLKVTLVEATGKKVAFLSHLVQTLLLKNVTAIHARAEDLGQRREHREKYDVATARAVAGLATLAEYALPFVRVGGIFIAQKGVAVETEIEQAQQALARLGGRVQEIAPVQLPDHEQRHLVVVAKVGPTPKHYPRRAGTPRKSPIR